MFKLQYSSRNVSLDVCSSRNVSLDVCSSRNVGLDEDFDKYFGLELKTFRMNSTSQPRQSLGNYVFIPQKIPFCHRKDYDNCTLCTSRPLHVGIEGMFEANWTLNEIDMTSQTYTVLYRSSLH